MASSAAACAETWGTRGANTAAKSAMEMALPVASVVSKGQTAGDDVAGQSGAQQMIHLALRGRLRAGGGDAQPVVGVQHGDVGEQTASAQGVADDGKEGLGGGRGSRLVQTRPERRKCTQQGDGGGILCPAAGGIRAHGGIYWLF